MIFELFGHKCKMCGKETKEILHQFNDSNWLCRTHLIELFSKDFLAYTDKMVIFHPEFEKVCKSLYGYYPLAEMGFFTFNKETTKKMEELLNFINGHCAHCQNEAQVLYFPKGFLDYSGSTPHIEKVYPSLGELLCLNHALAEIQADLESNPGFFKEGLYIPYAKSGMYVSDYL